MLVCRFAGILGREVKRIRKKVMKFERPKKFTFVFLNTPLSLSPLSLFLTLPFPSPLAPFHSLTPPPKNIPSLPHKSVSVYTLSFHVMLGIKSSYQYHNTHFRPHRPFPSQKYQPPQSSQPTPPLPLHLSREKVFPKCRL